MSMVVSLLTIFSHVLREILFMHSTVQTLDEHYIIEAGDVHDGC